VWEIHILDGMKASFSRDDTLTTITFGHCSPIILDEITKEHTCGQAIGSSATFIISKAETVNPRHSQLVSLIEFASLMLCGSRLVVALSCNVAVQECVIEWHRCGEST
jgi:hypothetical protein